MKFLVLSDVHGRDRVSTWALRLAKEHGVDAYLVLGDITHFGPASWASEFLSRLDRPVFAVPGNCDPPLVCDEIERSATLLHARKLVVEGETLIGLGGSNPTIFETPFEMEEDEIESALRPLMEPSAVMVLHTPPQGINDMISTGAHVGSTAILKLVDEFHPKVVLSGHIHEDRGIVERDGTLFMNPGAAKDGFSGVLEIGEKVSAALLDAVED